MKKEIKSKAEILQEYPSVAALIKTVEEQEYLDGMSAQHFKSRKDPEARTMGSVIYSESCPDSMHVLELVAAKLGQDDSADREALVKKGAPASCMLPFCNYYIAEGLYGQSRIVSVRDLSDDTKVQLKPSPKGSPSLIISSDKAPARALQAVNFATVIVGPADGREGKTVWTMHAGHPAPMIPIQKDAENRPARDNEGRMFVPESFGWKYGDELTVAEVKAKIGEDAFISIEMASPKVSEQAVQTVETLNTYTQDRVKNALVAAPEGILTKESLANLNHLEVKINTDLKPILDAMNAELGLHMQPRPEGFHVTIIGPTEIGVFKTITDEQLEKLNALSESIARGEAAKVVGMGMVDGSKDPVPSKDNDKKSCYIALDPTAINECRAILGLKPRYPHITLGFENGDIHMQLTGEKDAKGKDVLAFYPKSGNAAFDKFLPLIPKLDFGHIGGPEKPKKGSK